MPTPTEQAHAAAWLKRCHERLALRRVQAAVMSGYYDGDQPLEFASERFRKAFRWLLKGFADNWMRVVVHAPEERLKVVGFRFTDEAVTAEAHRIWQVNDMDALAPLAHTEAHIHGESYVTVWVSDDERTPEITAEHPTRALLWPKPKRLHEGLAGLRTYEDEERHERAELFLPDGVWLYRSEKPVREGHMQAGDVSGIRWVPDDSTVPDGFMENPFGQVPMVALPNAPRLSPGPIHLRSEMWPVLALQDALNKLVVDMIVTSEYQSFRQRWVSGLELEYDENDNPIPPFHGGADRLWTVENKDAKFGDFAQADLSQFVKAIDTLIVHVASIASVPPHYLNASADRLSGESIKAAESGLVSKVRRKMVHYGDARERVMRLAGLIAGHEALAKATALETIWGDPEIRTDAAQADAAAKRKEIGVPWRQSMEDLGYTPEQIARMEQDRAGDALLGLVSGSPAATGAQAGGNVVPFPGGRQEPTPAIAEA